jgi:hypothetical protein
MPDSVPAPVVATLPQNDCLDGMSDDGVGNFALGYTAGSGPNYPNYLFFTIQNGQAVRVGGTVPGGDESSTLVYSQPSGFTSFHQHGATSGSAMMSWSHDGQLMSTQPVAAVDPKFQHFPSSALAVDPSGGTATLVHAWDDAAGNWKTFYKRYDKSGAAETGEVVLDHRFPGAAAEIVVALSGHALAIESISNNQFGNGEFSAQWLARDGTPIGGAFQIFGGPSVPVGRFLMDGSVVIGFRTGGIPRYTHVTWTYQIQDGATTAGAAPAWLTQRAGDVFWPIRNGKGYAMMGSSACGAGAVEILASSTAKSCGCLKIPNARNTTTVGRDGSLIVPGGVENFGTCHYALYPQLLK